jgi:hypothetical protein
MRCVAQPPFGIQGMSEAVSPSSDSSSLWASRRQPCKGIEHFAVISGGTVGGMKFSLNMSVWMKRPCMQNS